MNPLPLVVTCKNDFAHHLVPATDESTIEDIKAVAASMVIGVRIPHPQKNLRLRRVEEANALDDSLTASAAGLQSMEWLQLDYD